MKNLIKCNKYEFLLERECILFFIFTKIVDNDSIDFIFIHIHPRLRLLKACNKLKNFFLLL